MKKIKFAGLGLLLLLSMSVLQADESASLPDNVVELRNLANRAQAAGNREEFRNILARLHQLRPNNGEYMHQLVLAHAVLGELSEAFNMMLAMQRQGLSYDFDQSEDSANLRDKNLYSYLNDLMIRAGQPLGEFQQIAALDADVGQVEAIDWDPGREALLVGTVTDGRVLAVSRDGSFRELLRADRDNGLWGIHGLKVDTPRNRLWVTTAATPDFAGFDPVDRGRSALFEFRLDSLELTKRYPVPVDGLPHKLGGIALTSAGDLFFTDRSLPIVYMLKAGAEKLIPVFASRNLVNLRGITASGESGLVFVADYEMGILRFDPAAGEVRGLAMPDTLNLGGIDGLEYVDGALLVIQNGNPPERIMRLTLDSSGSQVTGVAPVIVAPGSLEQPTYGTLVDDKLVFLARSKAAADDPRPVRIAQTGVEGLQNIVPPDMQRFLEQQARQRMQRPGLPQEAPGADDAGGEKEDPEG